MRKGKAMKESKCMSRPTTSYLIACTESTKVVITLEVGPNGSRVLQDRQCQRQEKAGEGQRTSLREGGINTLGGGSGKCAKRPL